MTTDAKYWLLREHNLFSTLSTEKVHNLSALVNFKTAKKGEPIYFGNDETPRIYFLTKGIIKIIKNDEDGTETVTEVLQNGDLFGQITLSDAETDEYAVVVSDYITCCSIKIEDFEKVLSQNPLMALKFTKEVGRRLRSVENRYNNLVKKDVQTRFAIFLKEWAGKDGQMSANKTVTFTNYLTHQDIASLICSTRQTVTQLFTKFKEGKVLDYDRKHIYIYNMASLSA